MPDYKEVDVTVRLKYFVLSVMFAVLLRLIDMKINLIPSKYGFGKHFQLRNKHISFAAS
jgi:hypothetical protein